MVHVCLPFPGSEETSAISACLVTCGSELGSAAVEREGLSGSVLGSIYLLAATGEGSEDSDSKNFMNS